MAALPDPARAGRPRRHGRDRHRRLARASGSASPRSWSPRAPASSSRRASPRPWPRPSSSSAASPKAIGVAGNAADEAHQDEVIRVAHEAFGGLDHLVNNTGINPVYGPILDAPLDVARKIMDVNVLAAFSWTQKAIAAGLGEGDRPGAVVNVASIAGLGATGTIGWYAVSKAALIHLTVELAYQLGPSIRVNAVAPGHRQDPVRPGAVRGPRGEGRAGLPDEAARGARGHRGRRLVPAVAGRRLGHRSDPRGRRRRHPRRQPVCGRLVAVRGGTDEGVAGHGAGRARRRDEPGRGRRHRWSRPATCGSGCWPPPSTSPTC